MCTYSDGQRFNVYQGLNTSIDVALNWSTHTHTHTQVRNIFIWL